jgi:proteasome accessory factor B
MGAKSQFNRVVHILEAIQSGRYPTAGAIAAEYEVSERTIRRDIEWLRDFHNAPIEYDPRRRGYYLTDPTYRLPALTMTEGEMIAFTVGEQVLSSYRNSPWYEPVHNAFARIESLLPEQVNVSAHLFSRKVSVVTPPFAEIAAGVWEPILEATRHSRSVEISYRSGGYTHSRVREVHPYRLIGQDGSWYLIGWSEHHQEIRVFALSRIVSAVVTGTSYNVPADFNPEEYVDPDFGVCNRGAEGAREVRVRFDAEVAHLVTERRWHPTQRIDSGPDGAVELVIVTNQTDQVLFRVMGFGPAAEILAPPELRSRAAEWIDRMHQRYLGAR